MIGAVGLNYSINPVSTSIRVAKQSFNLFQIASWDINGFNSVCLIPKQNDMIPNVVNLVQVDVAIRADAIVHRV
ncbi:hypothetical protein D3C76_1618390 [compost metagenome]